MLTSEFDYHLPKELIAQKPIKPRDKARLMVIKRKTKQISHHFFYQLPEFLNSGDILVLNDSKVIPARLKAKKQTGGQAEILLLEELKPNLWEVLAKNLKKKNLGQKIYFPKSKKLIGQIKKCLGEGRWQIEFNFEKEAFWKEIYKIGETPTPPYIKQKASLAEYQTIYAHWPGSVAAPTAGFHFTHRLFKKLKKKGIKIEFVTLHIGLGTFQPVKTKRIENHQMHSEWAQITPETAQRLNQAKNKGMRIIAVGTTACRTLESFARKRKNKAFLQSGQKKTDLFIYPGYQFKFIDGLITNFHLPKSTLLMLVCALAGKELIFRAYQEAIKKRYRFYSFGDAMLIL